MTLRRDHKWHVVMFFAKKSKSGFLYDSYGTPGFGQKILSKESSTGSVMANLLQDEFEKGIICSRRDILFNSERFIKEIFPQFHKFLSEGSIAKSFEFMSNVIGFLDIYHSEKFM